MTSSLRPSSRTSATCVWPQQMTRASVRVAYCIVTAASRSAGMPAVWLPGEAWQASTSVIASAHAALGRQPTQVLELGSG